MRIVIELDTTSGMLQSISPDEQTTDAGGPADHLLADLDAEPRGADADDAVDGGAPPAWLFEAVELASDRDAEARGPSVAGPDAEDGGRAPDFE
jgi:hypothetical protein